MHGGAGLASIFGGLIVSYTMSGGGASLPLIGKLAPWQLALMLVGTPGLLVAVLVLTIREPVRRERRADAAGVTLGELFAYLGTHARVYATLMVGAGFAALASYGAFSWVPALYARSWGWSAGRTGTLFGIVTFVFGTSGLLASGLLAGRMHRAGVAAPYTRIMIYSVVGAIVPAALIVVKDDPYWTMGCVSLVVFFLSSPIGMVQTALQAITPNELRAQVIAVYMLVVTLVGLALGPSLVAAMTDYYYHRDAAVGSSIAVVTSAACAASILVLSLGVGAYRRKVQMQHA